VETPPGSGNWGPGTATQDLKVISVQDASGNEVPITDGEQVEIRTEHGGTVFITSDGSFSYAAPTDPNGYRGEDSFTYTIVDSDGSSQTAKATFTLVDPPTASPTSFAAPFDSLENQAAVVALASVLATAPLEAVSAEADASTTAASDDLATPASAADGVLDNVLTSQDDATSSVTPTDADEAAVAPQAGGEAQPVEVAAVAETAPDEPAANAAPDVQPTADPVEVAALNPAPVVAHGETGVTEASQEPAAAGEEVHDVGAGDTEGTDGVSDVFKWTLSDNAGGDSNDVTITNFAPDEDKLNLSDLLSDDNAEITSVRSEGGSTIVQVTAHGGDESHVLNITVDGVDLTGGVEGHEAVAYLQNHYLTDHG